MTADARTAKRAAMRRATLHLVFGVIVLDAVALLSYYLFVAHADKKIQTLFTGVWTVAIVLLVMVLLKRVRKARFGPTTR
jgi:uncharacterized membrane protein